METEGLGVGTMRLGEGLRQYSTVCYASRRHPITAMLGASVRLPPKLVRLSLLTKFSGRRAESCR